RELELVVERRGHVRPVDNRVVRADGPVGVLEDHDPGRDLVRPPDALRFLLVLAEVAGGVEELLRRDRRAEGRLRKRHAFAGLGRASALEVRAHAQYVERRDRVAVDTADLAVVVRDELHPDTRSATRAYVSAVFTSPSISRFSPSSTSISPVDVP